MLDPGLQDVSQLACCLLVVPSLGSELGASVCGPGLVSTARQTGVDGFGGFEIARLQFEFGEGQECCRKIRPDAQSQALHVLGFFQLACSLVEASQGVVGQGVSWRAFEHLLKLFDGSIHFAERREGDRQLVLGAERGGVRRRGLFEPGFGRSVLVAFKGHATQPFERTGVLLIDLNGGPIVVLSPLKVPISEKNMALPNIFQPGFVASEDETQPKKQRPLHLRHRAERDTRGQGRIGVSDGPEPLPLGVPFLRDVEVRPQSGI